MNFVKRYSEIGPAAEDISAAFDGWTVLSTGITGEYYAEKYNGRVEGGLTFILEKNGVKKKVILGYTELGEWLEHEEILPK